MKSTKDYIGKKDYTPLELFPFIPILAPIGFVYLWMKNKGRKNFKELKTETKDFTYQGLIAMLKLCALALLVGIIVMLAAAVYHSLT